MRCWLPNRPQFRVQRRASSLRWELCGSSLRISRALNTPFAVTMYLSALLVLTPSQMPYMYLGALLFKGCGEMSSHYCFTKRNEFLVLASFHAFFETVCVHHGNFDILKGCCQRARSTTAILVILSHIPVYSFQCDTEMLSNSSYHFLEFALPAIRAQVQAFSVETLLQSVLLFQSGCCIVVSLH